MDARIKKSITVLNYIIQDLKLSNTKQLSVKLGLDRPERIYAILRGKTSISRNLAKIINEKYPQYSIDWLLTGEGGKYINSDNESNAQKETSNNDDTSIIKSKYLIHSPAEITEKEVRMLAIFAVMYKDKLEKTTIFNTYLKTIRDGAIIEHQKELMKKYQEKLMKEEEEKKLKEKEDIK